MTEQEKAEEIVRNFDIQIFSPEFGWRTDKEQTKEIALIHVDEILKIVPYKSNKDANWIPNEQTQDWWFGVKEVLEKYNK